MAGRSAAGLRPGAVLGQDGWPAPDPALGQDGWPGADPQVPSAGEPGLNLWPARDAGPPAAEPAPGPAVPGASDGDEELADGPARRVESEFNVWQRPGPVAAPETGLRGRARTSGPGQTRTRTGMSGYCPMLAWWPCRTAARQTRMPVQPDPDPGRVGTARC